MPIDAGSIFMVVISPSLIAISIICSCKRKLKTFQSIDNKRAHLTEATNRSISKNDKTLSAHTSINSTTSNSSCKFRTTDNDASKNHEIIIITQKLPMMQTHKTIQKLSDTQSEEKIQKLSDMQSKEKIQQLPNKQSPENQTISTTDPSCKCLEKKIIIENDLSISPLGRSISSNASYINQFDLFLKKNDLEETNSDWLNILQHTEQIEQSIISDNDNDNVTECNALMIDDIIIFPSEIKWKLQSTVQRVQLQNPTDDRFAIKVKCTNNDLYRVKPVFTFVEPKSCAIFHIYRNDGIATVDQILFLTTSAERTDDDPRVLFADSTISN